MTCFVLETITVIPVNEIEKYGIPCVCQMVKANCGKNNLDQMEFFWQYFRKYWISSPSFIYSWNIHHHKSSKKKQKNITRTNNVLESYNFILAKIFNHSQPSLICFIETLEKEAINQVSKLDYIQNALIVDKKRQREDPEAVSEYSVPSVHYINFVRDCKKLEKAGIVQ